MKINEIKVNKDWKFESWIKWKFQCKKPLKQKEKKYKWMKNSIKSKKKYLTKNFRFVNKWNQVGYFNEWKNAIKSKN